MHCTFSLLRHLQVNYRPPSNMGIAIPLTDNFYHADRSEPGRPKWSAPNLTTGQWSGLPFFIFGN